MPIFWSLPWTGLLIAAFITNLQLISTPVQAYVPAVPANSSSTPGLAGLDVTDNSTVGLTWNPNGSYSTVVSYQQYGKDSKGISKGALLRVSEDDLEGKPATYSTNTPWIALINCDKNSTNTDMNEDIFSKVADRGAIAALLYSNTSDGCLMNDEYLSTYSHLFDIFTAKKPSTAILIQSQFNNINYSFTIFNPTLLNNSADSVTAALPRSAENKSPFIIATLRAANATGEESEDDPSAVPTTVYTPSNGQSNHHSGPSQSLAMIILYVIVSLVSALFIVVILSGAIRAFRHPERYGPRLYDPGYDGDESGGRTRAGGITQAILDTFPIVKFGRGNANQTNDLPYARNSRMEMKEWNRPASGTGHAPTESMGQFLSPTDRNGRSTPTANANGNARRQSTQNQESRRNLLAPSLAPSDGSPTPPRASSEAAHADKTQSVDQANISAASASRNAASPTDDDAENVDDALDPAAIGRETCPICIVDFEEGDDLRVLPCEGHHRFHKDCVDPWLLELSTSCPICREDFQALVNMAAAGEEEEDEQEHGASGTDTGASRGSSRAGSSQHPRDHSERGEEHDHFPEDHDRRSTHGSRFSKYIRFAQKRRRRSLREQVSAPAPAPAPAASEPVHPPHHEERAYPSI